MIEEVSPKFRLGNLVVGTASEVEGGSRSIKERIEEYQESLEDSCEEEGHLYHIVGEENRQFVIGCTCGKMRSCYYDRPHQTDNHIMRFVQQQADRIDRLEKMIANLLESQ